MSKASSKSSAIGAGTRVLAFAIGGAIVGAECYGQFDYVVRLDGFSYLAVASPLAPAIAALSLPFAERAKAAKQYLKALALGLAFVLAGWTVVSTMSERIHDAKAGNEAERSASHSAAARADAALVVAKAELKTAQTAADKVRGLDAKACTNKCLSIRATEVAARTRVTEAEAAVRKAQGQATTASDITPPAWLMPIALFLAGVVFVWYGTGTKRHVEAAPVIAAVEEIKPVAATKRSPDIGVAVLPVAAKKSRKRTTQRKSKSAQLIDLSWQRKRRQAMAANEN
jgi:hypothetical protein